MCPGGKHRTICGLSHAAILRLSKLNIIGSDNDLSPVCRQAIIWTNAGILLIGPLGTHFSEMLIEIYTFSFKKMQVKMLSVKRQPFCLGLNVLNRMNCTICHKAIFHTTFFHYLSSVPEKLLWFIKHLSDGLYIFYSNLWNLSSEILT